MSVYFIAQIKITDGKIYQKYLDDCDEIFSKYNGKYLALDSTPQQLEGKWDYTRTVLIEFPNKHDFNNWYFSKEYQRIVTYRLSGAICDSILVKGK